MATDSAQAPKYPMRFGNAERLGVFTNYQFFTPALLYLHGRFTDAPLLDFMREAGRDVQLLHAKFERPIFRGMECADGDADWNHVLWAVASEHWPAFENFMLSAVFHDPASQWIARVGTLDVTVADPLYMDHAVIVPAHPPTLDVVVFGVDSNVAAVAVEVGPPPFHVPTVVFHPPQEHATSFAKLLFSGDNPNASLTPPVSANTPPVILPLKDVRELSDRDRDRFARDVAEYRKETLQ